MTLATGTKLGAYEILAAIGAGGMGEVYKAKDTRLSRDVAVKVLPEEFFEGEERRQRFDREARLLAALNHPGIAAIYSFEEIPSSSSSSSRPVLQDKFTQLGARLSPDGRWLAHESEESGTREIFVRSFPEATERRQVSIRGGTQARWRSDGKELFYVAADRKIMAVDIRTQPKLEADPPRALFQTRILPTIEARNHYDVTPDGKRFIVNSRLTGDDAVPITVVVGWTPETK